MRALRTIAALALALAACTASVAAPPSPGPTFTPRSTPRTDVPCIDNPGDADRGRAMLAGRYRFGSHEEVRLPANFDWTEDPLRERNWEFRFHNLRWTEDLIAAWKATGEAAYIERYRVILRDWLRDNALDRKRPRSAFAWDDHSTAQRAAVYACATRYLDEPWLDEAIREHGRVLARDRFYVRRGNHALNQNIGLFMAACALEHEAWKRVATRRLRDLGARSIDEQGVTNEQSVFYQLYNYRRYGVAVETFEGCGTVLPDVLDRRRDRMPRFLAFATWPDKTYVRFGDTIAREAERLRGTVANFSATKGKKGSHPEALAAVFDAGYAFGRTGWGEDRAFRDEVMYALRFGRSPIIHGHHEGTSLQLYGWGGPVLEDAGAGRYRADNWRRYFTGPWAHNRVVVERAFHRTEPTRLIAHRIGGRADSFLMRTRAWNGVVTTRRVLFSRSGGYAVVQDVLDSNKGFRAHQLWHLPPNAGPTTSATEVTTDMDEANVTMRWLGAKPKKLEVAEGERRPIRGWISYKYGEWEPAPVIDAIGRGKQVRFLTVIVPWDTEQPTIETRLIKEDARGAELIVSIDGRRERVRLGQRVGRVDPR